MKVTIIIDHFVHANAGTEHQLSTLLQGLTRVCDVEVISFRDSPWLVNNAKDTGFRARLFRIDNFRAPRTYINLLSLWRHLRKTRPQVVHTFFPVANIFGVLVAHLAGVPAVIASRRDYGEWMTPRYLWATRHANRFVDMIVTNASPVARLTHEKEGVPEARIAVIHNGIDAASFRDLKRDPELLMKLGIPPEGRIVGLVANYRPMKRHETLLKAAVALCARRSDVHFLLVGKNMTPEDIESRLRQQAAASGFGDRIHFVHADGNVRSYLGIIDIAVNCSEGEGLSNAIMEYMAAGLPCVAAQSGGNSDLIEDGSTGMMFPLGDHEELGRKIEALLVDRGLAYRMGHSARERVGATFGIDGMVDRFVAVYRAVAAGRPVISRRAP